MVRWSRTGVPVRSLANAYGGFAESEFQLGRWDDGLAHVEVAISVSADAGRAWDGSYVHAVAAFLHASRGDWESASEHVAAARRAAEAAPLPRSVFYARAAAGYLAGVRADWEAVREEVGWLPIVLTAGQATGLGKRSMQAIAAEVMAMSGRLDDAERIVGLIEAELDESLADPTRIDAWRLRGLIAHTRECAQQAQAAFERGRQVADRGNAPLAEGLLDLAHGQFTRRKGSRRAAIGLIYTLPVSRSLDNQLSGTVRLPDGGNAHSSSGTLELMRVFEEMVPPGFDEAAADAAEVPGA